MKDLGLYVIFIGALMSVFVMSELVKGKLFAKQINYKLEMQKVKTWMPVAVVIILIGIVLEIVV